MVGDEAVEIAVEAADDDQLIAELEQRGYDVLDEHRLADAEPATQPDDGGADDE